MNDGGLFRLDGRTALVTGGARHLGRDMAEALAAFGADVVVTARDRARAETAADEIARTSGRRALGLGLDVRDAGSIDTAVAAAAELNGRIDILVNNAGGGSGRETAALGERPAEAVRDLIETNLTGTILVCSAVGPLMVRLGRGKIINIASVAGLVGRDRSLYRAADLAGQPVDYAAAKAGVIGLTRDLAGLLSPYGVHVNAVSPGGFGPRALPRRFVDDYAARTPLGRMGRDGHDLKGVAVFLASEASDYITGQNIVVDGGFAIWK